MGIRGQTLRVVPRTGMSSFRSFTRSVFETLDFLLPNLLPNLGARTCTLQQHSLGKICSAGIAQLVEQLICNQQVIGSSPIAGSITMFASG